MKTSPAKLLLALALSILALAFTGCAGVTYEAEEVHSQSSFPGYSRTTDATGIKKTETEDGRVVRKAESLTHNLSVMGFSRTSTYKGAVIESDK